MVASVCALLLVLWVTPSYAAEPPSELARQARQAERKGDALKAYLLYSQAAAADPKRPEYWMRSQALRTRALQQAPRIPAAFAQVSSKTAASPSVEPPAELPEATPDDLKEARQPLAPPQLEARPVVLDFDLNGDAKSLFEQVLKAYGLDQVFDADYQPGTPFRFRLQQVDFRTAIRALEAATSSFLVPLSDKLCMVYKDTQQKRNEAEPMMAVSVSLPNTVTVQEAQELGRAVQQVLEMRRVAIDNGTRTVVMRDTVSKVRTAQKLYAQLVQLRSQVMVEVEILDVQSRYETNYGLSLPTSTGLAFFGGKAGFNLLPGVPGGFTKFLSFGGGLSTAALAVADARLFANFTRSNSQSLFRAAIRSVDSQAATLHVGDKYPLITQQYIGSASGVSPLAAPPTFNFEDLGLTLKVTPRIHSAEEVSLQVEAEFKLLGSGSYNGIPVIANRKFASVIRLRAGEWAVMAGLMSQAEAHSVSGIAGLGRIPVLSALLNQTSRSREDGQVLVVIKPHILDAPPLEGSTRALFTGSEGRWSASP